MIRCLLTPETNDLHIALPDSYIWKKIEVLVFTFDDTVEDTKTTPDIMAQFWGVISDKTTAEMHKHIEQSRSEWERDI